jgi:hypothetical protein
VNRKSIRCEDNRPVLSREEYVEQAYFFRAFRERLEQNTPTQHILLHLRDEALATTNLPYAIDFMLSELRHSGLLTPVFQRLSHYFTPFQAFVIAQAESERHQRFSMELALAVLEREAEYKAKDPTPAGLFVYQFETLCRNRLGYEQGLEAMAGDPLYDEPWKAWIRTLIRKLGIVDLADLIFVRSEYAVTLRRRLNPSYKPRRPVLFGEKEGRIARANRGKDPLFLFSALQRQLGYPQVPRPEPADPQKKQLELLERRVQNLEARLKLLEEEAKGELDISRYVVRPDSSS